MRPAGRAIAAVTVPVAVIASLWYVQAPPRTRGDYRERAAITAASLRSQVKTAGLWVDEIERERVTHQAAQVALREAEDDAVATASEFDAWNPPANERRIRSDITALASETTDALTQLRIAAEDGRWHALSSLARPLPQLAKRLGTARYRADP